jgi:hypothetical protein
VSSRHDDRVGRPIDDPLLGLDHAWRGSSARRRNSGPPRSCPRPRIYSGSSSPTAGGIRVASGRTDAHTDPQGPRAAGRCATAQWVRPESARGPTYLMAPLRIPGYFAAGCDPES